MKEKPIFIPLKAEFFEAFERGEKTHEYRLYGPRWNEKTCRVGRAVVLSYGYGKRRRLAGKVKAFTKHEVPPPDQTSALERCYGDLSHDKISDIEIEIITA